MLLNGYLKISFQKFDFNSLNTKLLIFITYLKLYYLYFIYYELYNEYYVVIYKSQFINLYLIT